jgi:flavin reductase (DIM6/NTAB) family NADH-FMN oxidoreductase RutF
MQYFCGAVTVVSTEHEGHDFGMTATAVCSISDTPPMVMVCINKNASIHRPLSETGRCAISILSEFDIEVAQKFSSKDENMRRERLKHFTGGDGRRHISGALAVVHCSVVREVDCGTHTALFAEVEESHVNEPDARPLLYFHQAFHIPAVNPASQRPQRDTGSGGNNSGFGPSATSIAVESKLSGR